MKIIIGKNAGFCYGVKRAVDGAKDMLTQEQDKVYCLGELVHNSAVMQNLLKQGLVVVEDIHEVSHKTIVRAHGVPKEVYEYAQENQIEIVDYTCPNVARIHDIVSQYVQNDFFVFLFGNREHPETIATKSFCNEQYFVIEKEEDIEEGMKVFDKSRKQKLLIVSQTTYSTYLFENCVQKIRKMLPENIALDVQNTICNATQIRQKETKDLAQEVDLMVIVGGKHSSNTQKLFEIAKENCKKSICTEGAEELKELALDAVETIGVMAGASTSKQSIDEVVQFLENKLSREDTEVIWKKE